MNDAATPDAAEPSDKVNILLGVLTAVESNSQITQRSMSKELGIALGLTNAYLKRCIKKGYVKVQQIPANRYRYYLTPQGFAEKGRLTAEYLSQGLKFFRVARRDMSELFALCEEREWQKIALYGLTELTEIALMSCGAGIAVQAIVDDATNRTSFNGIPVIPQLSENARIDAVVICDLNDAMAAVGLAARILPRGRILVPALLNSSKELIESGGAI